MQLGATEPPRYIIFNLNLSIPLVKIGKGESNTPLLHLPNLGQQDRIELSFVMREGLEPSTYGFIPLYVTIAKSREPLLMYTRSTSTSIYVFDLLWSRIHYYHIEILRSKQVGFPMFYNSTAVTFTH